MQEITGQMKAAILNRWPEGVASEFILEETEIAIYPSLQPNPPPVSKVAPTQDIELHPFPEPIPWETLEVANGPRIRVVYDYTRMEFHVRKL